MRATGLRNPVSVSRFPLPKPVLSAKKRSKPETDPNHGLWGFFVDKKCLLKPEQENAHGPSPCGVA